MGNTIGSLEIDLRARLGKLQQDLGQARAELRKTADDMKGEFRRSSQESRQQIEILGDAIGVRLPREIRRMIAESKTAQGAISAAFSIAGPLAFAAIVVDRAIPVLQKLYDHFNHIAELNAKIASNTDLYTSLHKITEQAGKLREEYEKIGKSATQLASIELVNAQTAKAALELRMVHLESLIRLEQQEAQARLQLAPAPGAIDVMGALGSLVPSPNKDAQNRLEALRGQLQLFRANSELLNKEITNAGAKLAETIKQVTAVSQDHKKVVDDTEAAYEKQVTAALRLLDVIEKAAEEEKALLSATAFESSNERFRKQFEQIGSARPIFVPELSAPFEGISRSQQAIIDLNDAMRSSFDSMFLDMQLGTRSLSQAFESMAASIAASISRMVARMIWMAIIQRLLTGIMGIFSPAIPGVSFGAGSFGSISGGGIGMPNFPGRAAGGPVYAGAGYIVGETGAELFVPRTSGQIVPAGGMTGAKVDVHIHNEGQPLEAQRSHLKFDGEKYIVDVVVKNATQNGAIAQLIRGGR